jgi:hypothetical protein
MAERDHAAAHIQPRRVGACFLQPSQRHRREGFVHLVKIDFADFRPATV